MRIITDTTDGTGRDARFARMRRAPVWLEVDPSSVPVTGGRAP